MITNRHAKKCFRLAMIEQDEEQCNEYLNVVETYFTQQEKKDKLLQRILDDEETPIWIKTYINNYLEELKL